MEFKITVSIQIDIDWIIVKHKLNSNSNEEEIRDSVSDYLFEESAYFGIETDLLSWDDILKICEEIARRLKKEEN